MSVLADFSCLICEPPLSLPRVSFLIPSRYDGTGPALSALRVRRKPPASCADVVIRAEVTGKVACVESDGSYHRDGFPSLQFRFSPAPIYSTL